MKRIWIYIGLTFVTSWFIAYAMISGDGLDSRWASVLIMLMMAMPALANALTRIATGEGFRGQTGVSGLHLRPQITGKKALKYYAIAWLVPIAAAFVGALLYFVTHPSLFDGQMRHYVSVYQEAYAQLGREYSEAELHSALRSEVLIRMTFYPCLNIVMCLASEFGWRGYLLTHLTEKYSRPAAVLISGIVWGLWYGPLIEMGQYYGTEYPGYPYTGMAVMLLICVALGCFYSWLMLHTGTVVAPAIASAVFQSVVSVAVYFCASDQYDPLFGPASVGLIGGLGVIAVGVASFVSICRCEKNL